MRRSKDGSARTIKHLTWKQFLAGEDKKDKFAGYVKQEKQRYKALADAKDSFNNTLDGLKDAVKGYYESSNSLRSRRLVTAHSVSLGVASDLTKKTINDVQRDTAFLKKRGNSLHNATEAVADYFEETQTVIDDLHRYVREKAVRSDGVAADDAPNQGEPGDMRGRLAVWSAHLRPSTGKLIEKAYDRSKALDDEIDYRK